MKPALAALAATVLCAGLLGACSTTRTVNGEPVSGDGVAGSSEADAHQRAAVRLRLASSYYQNGQMQFAIDAAKKAVELDPASAQGHALLGILQLDLGQMDAAQASFQRAITLGKDNPEIANNYGWYLCRTGHTKEAIPWFEKAAADRLYATPAQALLNAGICEIDAGENASAEKHLLAALVADGTFAPAKYRLSLLYLRTHKLERADFYYDLLAHSPGGDGPGPIWLGIRIAHARGIADVERRLSDDLFSRFGNSAEAESLRRGKYDE